LPVGVKLNLICNCSTRNHQYNKYKGTHCYIQTGCRTNNSH